MNLDEYLALIERRLRKSFNILYDIKERGMEIDLFANSIFMSSNNYKNKLTTFNKYEIYEKYYFKHYTNINVEEIQSYFGFLRLVANEQLPSYQHLYKCIVGVMICDSIDDKFIRKIQSVKFKKPFDLYFSGWSEIQFLCIDLSARKIYSNKASVYNNDLFVPY